MWSQKHLRGVNSRKKKVKFVILLFFSKKNYDYKKIPHFFYINNNYQISILNTLFPLKIHKPRKFMQQKLKIDLGFNNRLHSYSETFLRKNDPKETIGIIAGIKLKALYLNVIKNYSLKLTVFHK